MNNWYIIIRHKKDILYLSLSFRRCYEVMSHVCDINSLCGKQNAISTLFSWTKSHVHLYTIINHENSLEILELKIELISVAFYNDNNK